MDVRIWRFSAIGLTMLAAACGSSSAETKSSTPTPATSASATTAPTGATTATTAPSAHEEDFSAWVGSYPFEESAPGFAWAYKINLEKMPEGFRAHLTIDGNQTATRVLCTLRSAGPNKIDLLYLRDEKDHVGGPRQVGEHLLSLERGANGKAEYRWASIQPNIAPPKDGPAEIGDANAYVKKYPADFLAVKAVKTRLEKLLGAAEAKRLDEFIATQDVIKKNGEFLELEGFFPHSGGSQKALVLYDIKSDKLHVLLSDQEKANALDIYSEQWTSWPKVVETHVKAWSLPALKIIKHKK